MFTLIITEHKSHCKTTIQKDLNLQYCYTVATKGDYYKVQIVDQSDDSIYLESTCNKIH